MIVNIAGAIHAGKDTIAEYLVKSRGYVLMRWSDAIVDEALEDYQGVILADRPLIPMRTLADPEARAQVLRAALTTHRTPVCRALLQDLGMVRRKQDPDYWCKKTFARVDALAATGHLDVAIAGTRFPNELLGVKARFGANVLVVRPGREHLRQDQHRVEHGLDGVVDWDGVFFNDGTIAELEAKVDAWARES